MSVPDLSVPKSALSGIVTIGNFDGVHRGHQAMLATVRAQADAFGCATVAVTFDPHPASVLRPDVLLPRLTTISRRTQLLRSFGADHVVVLPVTRSLLQMSPELFFAEIVVGQLHSRGVVEGPDFRFGKDRAGDTTTLQQLCATAGVAVNVIAPAVSDGAMISSTQIRHLLTAGRIEQANCLFGHRYAVAGTVTHGAGRGRLLSFPTANLEQIDVLIPSDGVYAGACRIRQACYPVAVHIGHNPTFEDGARKVECHLIGFTGDLYDQRLEVEFLKELRPLQKFSGPEQLSHQIHADIAACVAAFEAEVID
ncbi:MAG: bifunctional riboflavin kinase/FAD synthetase [Planctomycetaceae bacterium]